MRKRAALFSAIVGAVLCLGILTHAQEESSSNKQAAPKEDTNGTAKTPPTQRQATAYHLDFSLNELEDGKKLNTRRYAMNLTDSEGGAQNLKIGTRVPMQVEPGKFEYLDLGTSISARMTVWTTPIVLNLSADISSFATPDEAMKNEHPLVREMRISGSTVLVLNKPIIVGSVDDPNSRRQFQLEVVVSKLQ
jgi:hypothetical protein